MFVLLLTSVTALKECKEVVQPKDIPCEIITTWDYINDCNTYEMKVYNQTPSLVYNVSLTDYTGTGRCNTTFNITTKGSYIFNISNGGDSGRIIVEVEEDEMASLAITVFILIITGGLFWLSTKKEIFRSKYANIIARRSALVLAIYLMILNSAIMATIAENAGLALTQEMFFFMRLFGFIGYPAMIILMLSALFQSFRDMKMDKRRKRTGDEEEYDL